MTVQPVDSTPFCCSLGLFPLSCWLASGIQMMPAARNVRTQLRFGFRNCDFMPSCRALRGCLAWPAVLATWKHRSVADRSLGKRAVLRLLRHLRPLADEGGFASQKSRVSQVPLRSVRRTRVALGSYRFFCTFGRNPPHVPPKRTVKLHALFQVTGPAGRLQYVHGNQKSAAFSNACRAQP